MSERGLLHRDDLAAIALSAAVLPRYPADKVVRSPVTIQQDIDGSAEAFWAKKFHSVRSMSIDFSDSGSDNSFFAELYPSPIGHAAGLLGMHPAVLLPPAMVSRLHHFDATSDVDVVHTVGEVLLDGLDIANNLLRCVPRTFDDESTAESSQMETLIYPGPHCEVDVILIHCG